jgi:hypothetical protein
MHVCGKEPWRPSKISSWFFSCKPDKVKLAYLYIKVCPCLHARRWTISLIKSFWENIFTDEPNFTFSTTFLMFILLLFFQQLVSSCVFRHYSIRLYCKWTTNIETKGKWKSIFKIFQEAGKHHKRTSKPRL